MNLKGKVVLVTGAGSGLGAATARHFAGKGARVAVLDLNRDAAESVAENFGGFAVAADVSDAEAVDRAFDATGEALGDNPHIVVNCAGVGLAARIVSRDGAPSFDVFEKTLKVNLFGTYNVMTHAARRMMAQEPDDGGERGVIINTSSVAWEG